MEIKNVIIWFQSLAHVICRVEGRREPSHAGHHCLGEPVGSFSFSSNVDTSNYNVSYENTKYIIVASPSGPVVTDDSYDPGIFDDPGYTGIDTGD